MLYCKYTLLMLDCQRCKVAGGNDGKAGGALYLTIQVLFKGLKEGAYLGLVPAKLGVEGRRCHPKDVRLPIFLQSIQEYSITHRNGTRLHLTGQACRRWLGIAYSTCYAPDPRN